MPIREAHNLPGFPITHRVLVAARVSFSGAELFFATGPPRRRHAASRRCARAGRPGLGCPRPEKRMGGLPLGCCAIASPLLPWPRAGEATSREMPISSGQLCTLRALVRYAFNSDRICASQRTEAMGPGFVKSRKFNLDLEFPSRFRRV
jgi:hypothetical protein